MVEKTKIKNEMLTSLGDRLHDLERFCCSAVKKANRPDIEIQWYNSVASALRYSIILIRCYLNDKNLHELLENEEGNFIVGKISITSFLDTINRFEQFIKILIRERTHLEKLIRNNLTKKRKKIEINRISVGEIRKILFDEKVINQIEYDLMCFAWRIRNCIHQNFVTDREFNFEYPDIRTGKVYKFEFLKNQELYHPSDLLSFFVITEQLVFIMICIMQRTDTPPRI